MRASAVYVDLHCDIHRECVHGRNRVDEEMIVFSCFTDTNVEKILPLPSNRYDALCRKTGESAMKKLILFDNLDLEDAW